MQEVRCAPLTAVAYLQCLKDFSAHRKKPLSECVGKTRFWALTLNLKEILLALAACISPRFPESSFNAAASVYGAVDIEWWGVVGGQEVWSRVECGGVDGVNVQTV